MKQYVSVSRFFGGHTFLKDFWRFMMKRCISVCLFVLLFLTSISSAATINVPLDYSTIQAAIDAAVDGVDEVVVADDTYSGVGNYDLNFRGKAITVKRQRPGKLHYRLPGSGPRL